MLNKSKCFKGSLSVISIVVSTVTFFSMTNTKAETCPSGIVSYWELNDGTGITAADSIGPNPGTLISDPVWTTSGRVDGALSFDGTNYVKIEDSSSLDITTSITLEAWVYPTKIGSGGEAQDILSKHASGGGYEDAYCLQMYPNGEILFILNDGSFYMDEGYVRLHSTTLLPANQWSHVVGAWDGTTMRIYINGVQESNTAAYTRTLINSPLPIGIGRNGGDGWFEYFYGIIDEVAIYNRALTNDEIQQHYQNGLTGLGYCEDSSVKTLSCQGFEPPMDKSPVSVNKNKVLPFKASLLDGDLLVTGSDIVSPPVIQVLYSSGVGDATDVTEYALPAGQGTEGNEFAFDGTWWHYNLQTKNYTARGTYTTSLISGDSNEYVVSPVCTADFVIK